MKILIVRHADPDYAIDNLTEKGQKEAFMLSERLTEDSIKAVYCSTMGRAKHTVDPTLKMLNMNAEYYDWLCEFFAPQVKFPYFEHKKYCWDILPEFLEKCPELYSPFGWYNVDFIKESDVPSAYNYVCGEFDKILSRHGYDRKDCNYKTEKSNHDTLVFICHFGVACVLISHLVNCSPYSIWQNTFLPPSSVTTFYSEERVEGTVSFRCSGLGDISHLYKYNEKPSFAGRFCECFTDNTRHD